jgi:hypothetical protein
MSSFKRAMDRLMNGNIRGDDALDLIEHEMCIVKERMILAIHHSQFSILKEQLCELQEEEDRILRLG